MRISVIQFLKSPEFAPVKTRMQPQLDASQCKRLHCNLARHVTSAIGSDCSELSSPPELSHTLRYELWSSHGGEFAEALVKERGWDHAVQCEGDLGQRLTFALTEALSRTQAVIFVGSDCPFIDADYICEAVLALTKSDVVVGPASDGGYVLLGLRGAYVALFEGIDWGSDRVLPQTLEKIQGAGLTHTSLKVLSDIDRPNDLSLLHPPCYRHLLEGVSKA